MDSNRLQRFDQYAHRVLRSSVLGVKRITAVFRKPAAGIPQHPERILVVKLWGLGGLLCATPVLQALRRRYPDSEIVLLTVRGQENLYRDKSLFDDVMVWEAERLAALPSAIRSFRDKCRTRPFDLAVNLDSLRDMAVLLLHASGAAASAGYVRRGESRRGYTLPVPIDESLHAVEQGRQMAAALGAEAGASGPIAPALTTAETESARETLANWGVDEHTNLIGVNMDAAEEPTRRAWTPEKYILLAQALEEMGGYKTVFFGSPDEDRFVSRHVKQMATQPINLTGRTSVRQFAALLTHLHLLVASNTGPLQLAASLGTPTLGILRPDAAARLAPPESERHALVIRERDPQTELPLDAVRPVLTDMLDHLADPDDPPWLSA